MNAMGEAKAIIARGGNPLVLVENYQKIVAAKVARLSALKMSELERAASKGRWI